MSKKSQKKTQKTGRIRRKLTVFERIIKAGCINFVRNAWLAVAAIAVMVTTLSIVLFSVIANATFTNTINQLTDRIDVSVFLKDEVTQEQLDGLVAELKSQENVESVEYISKDDALEEYKEQNQDNLELLLAISQTDNPLPASLRIKPRDPNRLAELRPFLERADIVALQSDETSYSGDRREAIDKITGTTDFFRRAGIFAVILFMVISMLMIFNTIRMAIFNRRDELNIMRLLGASTWFIRGPFIVETIIYGIIAGLLSVLICGTLFSLSSSTFEASSLGLLDIGFANTFFTEHYWQILGIQLGLGVFIGAASSFYATRRYLKFKTPKK
jgi:cell division transport system permease protein